MTNPTPSTGRRAPRNEAGGLLLMLMILVATLTMDHPLVWVIRALCGLAAVIFAVVLLRGRRA